MGLIRRGSVNPRTERSVRMSRRLVLCVMTFPKRYVTRNLHLWSIMLRIDSVPLFLIGNVWIQLLKIAMTSKLVLTQRKYVTECKIDYVEECPEPSYGRVKRETTADDEENFG